MSLELKEYFDNMFSKIDSNIKLDEDQVSAITNDDNYVLILAGAGTGKTTTMVGKVKYLVDIKKVDPSKILVISYTKKAVEELRTMINDEFNINADVTTFHSLAFKYVRKIFRDRKCEIVDYNTKEKIFYDFINNIYKEGKMYDLMNTFTAQTTGNKHFGYGEILYKNYYKYNSYDAYFSEYKKIKVNEALNAGIENIVNDLINKKINDDEYITTIKGELVKSASEAIIANFLYKHGIDYEYEKVYDRVVADRKIYKPDFTLNLAGLPVYIEYFGLDDEKYNRIKEKKKELHNRYHNKFIYLENLKLDEIESVLDLELRKMGFIYRDRNYIEIYNRLLDNNKLSEVNKLKRLFYDAVDQIKENKNRSEYTKIVKEFIVRCTDEELKQQYIKQFSYINGFYAYYSRRLINPDITCFDYSDLIYYSNKYINSKEFINDLDYDYIIIDEYQDISDGEYALARNTSEKSQGKVFAVGDDWQSIYSFRGSNITYITKFGNYFMNPTILSIKKTYRNSQELVDIAGEFIKENKDQISKDLISFKHLAKPIHFVPYDDRIDSNKIDESYEYEKLRELILKIHRVSPDHKILVLGRENKMIDKIFEYNEDFIDDLDTKVKIENVDDLELDAMTIHKSKGLTYDEVIIIGMNKNFPKESYAKFWLIDLFKPQLPDEPIKFAEERRIFYVALTRTKNNVFILYNRNAQNRSEFVDEILNICREKTDLKE